VKIYGNTTLTPSSVVKLEAELTLTTREKRKEIIAAIREAKGHGDLSENAEYDGVANDRIIVVQELLRNAKVVVDENNDDQLGPGGQADIKFLYTDDIEKLNLVSTNIINIHNYFHWIVSKNLKLVILQIQVKYLLYLFLPLTP